MEKRIRSWTKRLRSEEGFAAIGAAIYYAIVSAAVTAAVNKVIQLATGQDLKRTTFGIGPLSFSVGGGKPAFGLGLGIPGTPLNVGFMAGSGQKPDWSVGVKLGDISVGDTDLKIGVSGNYGWTGSEWTKGQAGVGVTLSKVSKGFKIPDKLSEKGAYTDKLASGDVVVKNSSGTIIGKASPTTTKMWDAGLKGKYDFETQAFGIELSGEKGNLRGGITLTQPKKGKPYIKLDTYYKYDDAGNKIAVATTIGQGKPIWQFSAGVNVGEMFRINLDAKTVGSHLDNWNVGLTKFSIPEGKKAKEKQITGKYKYDPDTEKGRFEFGVGIPMPITLNFGKEGFTYTVDSQNIADYIVDRLIPGASGKGAKQKIDYALQEVLFKGVQGIQGGEMSPGTLKTLAALGFGGKKGEIFAKAVPEDYIRYAQSLMPEATKGLKKWQVDFLASEAVKSFGVSPLLFDDLTRGYPSMWDHIEFSPSDATLKEAFIAGEINIKDAVRGVMRTTLDKQYAELRDYMGMSVRRAESREQMIDEMNNMDSEALGRALNTAIKDSTTKEELLEKLGPEQRRSFAMLAANALSDVKNMFAGLGGLAEMGMQGITKLADTFAAQIFGGLDDKAWDVLSKLSPEFEQKRAYFDEVRKPGTWIEGALVYPKFALSMTKYFYNEAKDLLTGYDAPYSREDQNNAKGINELYQMYDANDAVFWEHVTQKFFEHPYEFVTNLAFFANPFVKASGFTKAAKIVDYLDNPFQIIPKGTGAIIDKIADTSLGARIKSGIGSRLSINKIWQETKTAKLAKATQLQNQANDLIKNLEGFSEVEKLEIARASMLARGGNFIDELPDSIRLNPTKVNRALDAAEEFRKVSDSNTLFALEQNLMSPEQLANRRYAPLKEYLKTQGWEDDALSNEALYAAGFDPAYVPLYALKEGNLTPERVLDRSFEAMFNEKMTPYVGELENVKKLDLSIATLDHQKILGEIAALQNTADNLKNLPGVNPYNPSKGYVSKGYKLMDFEGTKAKLMQQTDFTNDYLTNLQIVKDADQAMAITLEKWNTPEKLLQLRDVMPKGGITLYEVPTYQANLIESNFGPHMRIPIYDDYNQMVRDSVLAFRPAWIINDFKNNAINYLISGRNPMSILRAMQEKYTPLMPDELQYSGYAAQQLMSPPPTGFYGRILRVGDKLTGGNVTKLRTAMYELDRLQDTMFKRGFFLNDLEQAARRTVLEDSAKSFFLAHDELMRLTDDMIDNWIANPAKYASTVQPIAENAMNAMGDWIYSYDKVWPLLTDGERLWLKRALFFPEIGYWGAKKIAKLPIVAPIQTAMLQHIGRIVEDYQDPEELPDYLLGATKIAENMFLRTLGGTIYDPEYGAMNYQNMGQLTPGLKTLVESMGGIDLRTLKPFSSAETPWVYNPDTREYEPLGEIRNLSEVATDLNAAKAQLDQIYSNLEESISSSEQWKYQKSQINYLKNLVKDYQAEYEAVEDYGVAGGKPVYELIMRNLPQYQWLEQMLIPFQQYGTGSLLKPEVIVDSQTGEPKYPISRWLASLRLFGVSISQVDIDEWRDKEATQNLRNISVDFREMLSDFAQNKPELLQEILDGMESGLIPFDDPSFNESPFLNETFNINYEKLGLPEPMPRAEMISAIADAKKVDIDAIDAERNKAIEMARAISSEFLSKVKPAIDELADQRSQQVKDYYEAMLDDDFRQQIYRSIAEADEITKQLKQYKDLPVDTYDLAKRIKNKLSETGTTITATIRNFAAALGDYFSDVTAGGRTASIDELTSIFSWQLGASYDEFALALRTGLSELFDLPAEVATEEAFDTWYVKQLESMAFDQWKKDLLKQQKLVAPSLTSKDMDKYLKQELQNEILQQLDLGSWLKEFTLKDLDSLSSETDLFQYQTEVDLAKDKAIEEVQKLPDTIPTKIKDLIIKGVIDMSEEKKKVAKTSYRSKVRMESLFTPEALAAAPEVLAKEIEMRRDFLADASYQSWMPHFDPAQLSPDKQIPITAWLTAMAAARLEAVNKIGQVEFEAYLETEAGESFSSFEKELFSALEIFIPAMKDREALVMGLDPVTEYRKAIKASDDFLAAYQAFEKNPSINALKDLYALHEATITKVDKIPILTADENKNTIAKFEFVKNYNSSDLETKFSELSQYDRTYASTEYRAYEDAVIKSYKTLVRSAKYGGGAFAGVLFQK